MSHKSVRIHKISSLRQISETSKPWLRLPTGPLPVHKIKPTAIKRATFPTHLLLVYGLLQPSANSTAVNNNNNNNNNKLVEAAELIDDKSPYYKYTPANVLQNENFKLYWNRSILTDKTIPFHRPDITFMNKKTKNTFLIDIVVPNTHNLAKTITDKQNKYQELANETCSMWK